jgi:hypothetical protein
LILCAHSLPPWCNRAVVRAQALLAFLEIVRAEPGSKAEAAAELDPRSPELIEAMARTVAGFFSPTR